MTGALQLLNTCCTFANPLLLNMLVHYVNNPHEYTPATAVLLAFGMFAANSLKSMILGQYFWRGFRLGLRTRASVGQAVYAKALKLAHEQRSEFGTGAVVSYMQIDAQKLADALPYMHLLWQGPLQLAIATYMLYHFMGPSVRCREPTAARRARASTAGPFPLSDAWAHRARSCPTRLAAVRAWRVWA